MNILKSKIALGLGVLVVSATNALAAWTVPTLDTGKFEDVAAAVVVALAVFWGIKRAISLIRG